MRPEPINDTDPARLVAELARFHQWFWPAQTRTEEPAAPIEQPPALAWALRHLTYFGQGFLAEEQPDGRLHCFEECGSVFGGYINSSGDNPLVTFKFLGESHEQRALPLNDLVVGAYFETIAFLACELDRPASVPAAEQLIWNGDYIYVDEPVRIWVNGEVVVLDFGPLFDGPVAIERLKIDMTAEIESFSMEIPGAIGLSRISLHRDADLQVNVYRPGAPVEPYASRSASAWLDLRHLEAEVLGWEFAGTTTISWSRLATLWHAVAGSLQPPTSASDFTRLHVHRLGADIGYDADIADLVALWQLQTLIGTATCAAEP